MNNERIEALVRRFSELGIAFEQNVALCNKSSFRIGGVADIGAFPSDADGMARVFECCLESGVEVLVVGNGTNMLFDDDGFRGCILFTEKMNAVRAYGERIYAECGAPLTAVANAARKNSLTGLEFAYGIPGSLGGAVAMNAGAYGGEISGVLESCIVLERKSGRIITIEGKDMHFSYRHSIITENEGLVCLGATFKLSGGDFERIDATMRELMERRRTKQPLEYPSAGSVFKRPAPDKFVGAMVESSGLKGYTVGGAQVSVKHAGFIINIGGATAKDVRELVAHIKAVVNKDYGVELECEIRTPGGVLK